VFKGPNEVGKSTIHQAILVALYGLGAKAAGLLKKDVQNWNGMQMCKVTLEYVYNDTLYQLARDILSGAVQLAKIENGQQEFSLVSEDSKNVTTYITKQIGLPNPTVFNYTVSIKQQDLAIIENLAEVSQAIERVFTGVEAITPEIIQKNLNGMRKKLKKTRNENPGQIDVLQENLTVTTTALLDAQRKEQERKDLEQKKEKLTSTLPTLKEQLETTNSLLERYELLQTKKRTLLDLKKQQEKLHKLLQRLNEIDTTIAGLRRDLGKHEILLRNFDKVSEFTYLRTRILELDASIGTLMGMKSDSTFDPESIIKKGKLASTSTSILLAFLITSLLLALAGIFLEIQPIFLASGAIALFSGAGLLIVQILQGSFKQRPTINFKLLLDERKQLEQSLHSIAELWGFVGEKISYDQIGNKLKMLDLTQKSLAKNEATKEALLDGDKKERIERELATLSNKIEDLQENKDETTPFSPSYEDVERWKHKQAELTRQIPDIQEQLHHAEGRLHELHKEKTVLQQLEESKEYYNQAIADANLMYQAIVCAQENFEEVIAGYQAVYVPQLQTKASKYFSSMTQERYSRVDLRAWPQVSVFSSKAIADPSHANFSLGSQLVVDNKISENRINPLALSQGTLDQLYFSLRLGAGELLSKSDALPLILDDPFVHYDRLRLREALAILLTLCQTHQVLYFTHNDDATGLLQQLPNHKEVSVTDMTGI
jgi:uncharacterized protein YhaN